MQTLPEAFVRQLTISLGPERAGEVVSFITGSPASTAVRINPFKVNAFPAQFASGRETFSRWGRLLDGRPEFALDPLFHAGAYYVQEASSMYLESILPLMLRMREERPEGPFAVLDLCAAPGGKSTHLLSMLREIPGSFLVSNEVIRSRASVLCENIAKWGAANVVVTNDDPADFSPLGEYFDVIVVDAPCSGEGMFRKDPEAVAQWSEDNVRLCAARQRRILTDILPCLRPGGLLVYSTCTFNPAEDEDNVAWLASQYGMEVLEQRHFYPGDPGAGEGFFLSSLRKGGAYGASGRSSANSRGRGSGAPSRFKEDIPWVNDGFPLFRFGSLLKAFPAASAARMLELTEGGTGARLRVLASGTAVAEVKDGRGGGKPVVIPQFSLIQSEVYRRGSLPEVEVPLETALEYLRRGLPTLPGAPAGYVVLTYEGVPSGLLKNLGNRCNNLLPPSLRLRIS